MVVPPNRPTGGLAEKRLKVLSSLSKTIWGEFGVALPRVVGINGIHQAFSTDECGYHVFRFAAFLYESVLPKDPAESWANILDRYLKNFRVDVLPYEYKYLEHQNSLSILLENDEKVRRFTEESEYMRDEENLIRFHHEYNLTNEQWAKQAKEYVESFRKLSEAEVYQENSGASTTITIAMFNNSKKKKEKKKINKDGGAKKMKTRRLRRKAAAYEFASPYTKNVNPITGQRYVTSFDDTFQELCKRSQTSVSREIVKALFPTHVNNKTNPFTNDIQYSGMLDNPDYLNTVVITLPGDLSSITSVGDYFKSMGVDLDPKDPYTYTLSTLLKSYFENHRDKKTAEQLFAKIQRNTLKLWKYVK